MNKAATTTPRPIANQAGQSLTRSWGSGVAVLGGVTIGRYLVTFLSQIALARLLVPEAFGSLALILTMVTGMATVATLSSKNYLVKQKEWSERHYNVAFTMELLIASAGFLATLALAHPVMGLMGRPELALPMQVFGLTLLLTPLTVTGSYLQREMRFRGFYLPALLGTTCNAGVAIGMACAGFSVWSLVVGRLVAQSIEALSLWWVAAQKPRIAFDRSVARDMFRFGWPLTGAAFLVHLYWHVDYIIVDRYAGGQALGFYFMAFSLCQYLLLLKVGLNQVAYPILARQNEAQRSVTFERLTWLNSVFYLFLAAVIVGSGDYLIGLVFGWRWYPCVPALKILIILTAWRGMTSYCESILLLTQGNKLLFKATLVTCLLLPVISIPTTIWWGPTGTALGVTIAVLTMGPFLVGIVERRANVSVGAAVARPMITFVVASTCGYLVQEFSEPTWGSLILSLLATVASFGLFFWITDSKRIRAFYQNRKSWLDATAPHTE